MGIIGNLLIDTRLAWRNATRQWRRSLFGLSAVALGTAALVLATGFIEWNFLHYREELIHTQLGHVRIHVAGYTKYGYAEPFKYLLPDDAALLAALRRLPEVLEVTPRLAVNGLISHGDATVPFIGQGVEPEDGRSAIGSANVIAGSPLTDDGSSVLLGQGLARLLGVAVGDSVALITSTQNGGINGTDARVRGIFTTVSKAYDDRALRLPIVLAQRLLRTKGAHTWMILLRDTDDTQSAVTALRRMLPASRFEVIPWWTLSDFYNKSSVLFARQVRVMKIIIGLLIVLSISNTLMMAVAERTSEIGTALALGATRRRVLRRFVLEGALLGLLGSIVGAVIGAALAHVISRIGIPVPAPPGMANGYLAQILVTPALLAGAVTLTLATAALASVYPALRASKMMIVDALRAGRA